MKNTIFLRTSEEKLTRLTSDNVWAEVIQAVKQQLKKPSIRPVDAYILSELLKYEKMPEMAPLELVQIVFCRLFGNKAPQVINLYLNNYINAKSKIKQLDYFGFKKYMLEQLGESWGVADVQVAKLLVLDVAEFAQAENLQQIAKYCNDNNICCNYLLQEVEKYCKALEAEEIADHERFVNFLNKKAGAKDERN
jgi:hypothetical protein